MTLKYESEILFDLMKRDGDDTPSDVLPYESELKEKYLEQVKGAYPKLQDYRSEWLNYNLNTHVPADFPIETLSNVTEATVYNVVPYAYKSAILKGQTLVNLINLENFTSSDILYTYDLLVTNNTTYTVIATLKGSDKIRTSKESVFRIKANNGNGDDLINAQQIIPNDISTIINLYQTIKITTQNNLHIRLYNTLPENLKIIILEGDHTQEDIPYFDGMQSVKIPVLTTSNEDDTKTNILTVNEDVTLRGIGDVQDTLDLMTGEVKKNVSDLETLEDISKYTQSGNTTTDTLVIIYSIGGTSKSGDRKFISTHEIAKYGRLVEWYGVLSFRFALPRSDSRFSDLNTFKSYIKDNPFEYIRVLEEEEKSIKTVDLTVTDQDGNTVSIIRPIEGTMHLMTEGDTIKPLFSGEIPVEAITQNLAYFIKE